MSQTWMTRYKGSRFYTFWNRYKYIPLPWKIFPIVFCLGLIFFLDTFTHSAFLPPEILHRLYYLPIVLSGLLFGFKGGMVSAVVVTLLFLPHWLPGLFHAQSHRAFLDEVVLFYAFGILIGLLVDRERLEAQLRQDQEHLAVLGQAAATIAQKAVAYGMPGVQVDGNDVFAVYRVAKEAVERARNGEGPTLIEAHTYRMSDHTTSDDARRYRTPEEVAFWQERDPVERLARYMRSAGLLDDTSEADIAAEAEAKVGGWVEAFEAISPPEPDEIFRHVFAEPTPALRAQREELLRLLDASSEGR